MNERELQEKLKKEIADSEKRMASCKHEFNKPISDPEEIMVQDTRAGYEFHGSDMWSKPSFHKEGRPRWSRECKHCGKKEFTYTQVPIVTEYAPKF